MNKVLAVFAAAGIAVLTLAPSNATAQESDQQNRIKVDITQVTPEPVTSNQPDTVTVHGHLTNVGDRRVSKPEIRLERGDKLDENGLRAALAKPQTGVKFSDFQPAAPALAPGQGVDFVINVTLHGASANSLEINDPGVYPLMVNVNGVPDFGGLAKVGQATTVLPVLSLPGGATLTRPATPAKVTVLWPLSDQPRLVTADTKGKAVLGDDTLATSLAQGGRLDALLSAYEMAPPGLSQSLCLAIDPDLVETVQSMAAGYSVQTPGATVAGNGQGSAQAWLDRLKRDVTGRCVFALPAADADLNALARAGATPLVQYAVAGTVLQQVLGAAPLTGLTWPIDGQLDPKTLAAFTDNSQQTLDTGLLRGTKVSSVLLSAATVPGSDPTQLGDKGPRVIRLDDLVSAALANGSAAALSALQLHAGSAIPLVVAPPHQWSPSEQDATALLNGVQTLADQQYLAPAGLATLASGPTPTRNVAPGYSEQGAELSPEAAGRLAETSARAWDFYTSMEQDLTSPVTPAQVMSPVFDGLLRAGSGVWRGDDRGAAGALVPPHAALTDLENQVGVKQPGSPITLASEDSPLPVRVYNNLPVVVKVGVKLQSLSGVTAQPTIQRIPAGIPRDVLITSTVVRSGRFTVTVSLTTTSGRTSLGAPARIELSSTAFGTVNLVITGVAAAALFGLSGRRVYRRITASRKRKREQQQAQETTAEVTAPMHAPVPEKLTAGVPGDERSSES
ncbi:DUF6049 family protein [Kutzneria sp. CA-103260]|uniref:DUF6049 family protein n=1 Tax=Kutzneria sp. CA-103260 TaxID=2802641 RepID=UPI001BA72043|nr:DUF6049 family protein [Kutzneria sp. CA-103260]QUQ70017.1 glycoprotein [Kutzneria sp. CA-103260]